MLYNLVRLISSMRINYFAVFCNASDWTVRVDGLFRLRRTDCIGRVGWTKMSYSLMPSRVPSVMLEGTVDGSDPLL